jgi:hypothetical protein
MQPQFVSHQFLDVQTLQENLQRAMRVINGSGESYPNNVPEKIAKEYANGKLVPYNEEIYYTSKIAGGSGGGELIILDENDNTNPEEGITNLEEGHLRYPNYFVPLNMQLLYAQGANNIKMNGGELRYDNFVFDSQEDETGRLTNTTPTIHPRKVPTSLLNSKLLIYHANNLKYKSNTNGFFQQATKQNGLYGAGHGVMPFIELSDFSTDYSISVKLNMAPNAKLPNGTTHYFKVIFRGVALRQA